MRKICENWSDPNSKNVYKCKRCGKVVKRGDTFVATGGIKAGMTQIVDAHYCDAKEKEIGIVELVGSDV